MLLVLHTGFLGDSWVRSVDIPISSRIFHTFFEIHTVKGFSIVKGEVDDFLQFSCFLYVPMNIDILIYGFSTFSTANLYILKFSVHVLLKPSLKDFEHNPASMWNEHSCRVVYIFVGTGIPGDWNENWSFPVRWPLLCLPNLLAYWMWHFYLHLCINITTINANISKRKHKQYNYQAIHNSVWFLRKAFPYIVKIILSELCDNLIIIY